ncbi:YdcF family protein [Nitratireductor mangrovi]|uniref:YdcF family protein n=1 Tax=Nitratireductor mangrovi TaxID=2599600 RepID=A0A5B8L3L7_9HYPH|nr:YdcF family protein [Nitratireductor mangrovi]QDZ02495.1 YdcF family protein [Nitratireductor mangrovi]
MFHLLSKVFWVVANPLSLSVLALIAALIATVIGWRRTATTATIFAFLILVIGGWTTAGALILQPLEERFPRPQDLPEAIAGIIVLGGGLEGAVNKARGGYELNSAGDRFVAGAVLGRRFPDARILISGGQGALMLDGEGDADTAPRLFEALGIARDRLLLENESRNTYENAEFSRRLVDPQPGEAWLLVTSAFHMPRSMALFRKAGFEVIAWSVDYRTTGEEGLGLAQDNAFDSLRNMSIGIREWIGLAAYYMTGRIETVLPAPR